MYTNAQRIIILIATITTFGLLAAYVYIQSREFLIGPTIIIHEPQDGDTYTRVALPVRGTAKHAAKLTLDGRKIYTDENGFFDETVLLSSGYNVIELFAIDRFNREKISRLEVVYQQ